MNAATGTSDGNRQPWALYAAVAVVIVVGCTLFEYYWQLHVSPAIGQESFDVYVLVGIVTPYLVYAIALAFWGLDGRHRASGSACAILVGLTVWGLQEGLLGRNHTTQTTFHAWEWAVVLVVPTGVALAWGLTRRRGRVWIYGILVAPALMTVLNEGSMHDRWWMSWEAGLNLRWRLLELYSPAIVAALVCWLLDVATRPSRTARITNGHRDSLAEVEVGVDENFEWLEAGRTPRQPRRPR